MIINLVDCPQKARCDLGLQGGFHDERGRGSYRINLGLIEFFMKFRIDHTIFFHILIPINPPSKDSLSNPLDRMGKRRHLW